MNITRHKELILYLIFGILTTLVNILSFTIFNTWLDYDYRIATTIAWLISVLFAYFTNKLYVFNSKQTDRKTIVRELTSFFGFRFISYFLDLFTMILLVEVFFVHDLIAKIVTNIMVVVFNYAASKLFIFKASKGNS